MLLSSTFLMYNTKYYLTLLQFLPFLRRQKSRTLDIGYKKVQKYSEVITIVFFIIDTQYIKFPLSIR